MNSVKQDPPRFATHLSGIEKASGKESPKLNSRYSFVIAIFTTLAVPFKWIAEKFSASTSLPRRGETQKAAEIGPEILEKEAGQTDLEKLEMLMNGLNIPTANNKPNEIIIYKKQAHKDIDTLIDKLKKKNEIVVSTNSIVNLISSCASSDEKWLLKIINLVITNINNGNNCSIDAIAHAVLDNKLLPRNLITSLFEKGLNVNAIDKRGRTLLYRAVEEMNIVLVKELILRNSNKKLSGNVYKMGASNPLKLVLGMKSQLESYSKIKIINTDHCTKDGLKKENVLYNNDLKIIKRNKDLIACNKILELLVEGDRKEVWSSDYPCLGLIQHKDENGKLMLYTIGYFKKNSEVAKELIQYTLKTLYPKENQSMIDTFLANSFVEIKSGDKQVQVNYKKDLKIIAIDVNIDKIPITSVSNILNPRVIL
ncbi:MAG: hypothetical protein H0X29_05740 [Parachlamydiaceae bacterium]|nr:hypothetical protein [Parachlamydiaceae bacterium]